MSYNLTFSFEPEIYFNIVGPPPLRIDALRLCSKSVPSSIVVINYILSHSNGVKRKCKYIIQLQRCKNADLQETCK